MKNKQIKNILFCSLLLLLLLLTSACGGSKSQKIDKNLTSDVSYLLVANKNATEDDIASDLSMIKKRLKALFHSDGYSLEKRNDREYELQIDRTKLKTCSEEEVLEMFVTERANLQIGFHQKVYQNLVYLNNEDIESIEFGDGLPDHIIWDETEEDDELFEENKKEEDYAYFSFRFSDRVSKIIHENIQYLQEGRMTLRQNDMSDGYETNHGIAEYYIYQDDNDINTFYMVYEKKRDLLTGHEKAYQSILSMPDLNYSFNYYFDWKEDLHWQKVDETDFCGSMQCNVSEFEKDYYTIIYSSSRRLAIDEKEYLERVMKSRLDFRGEKYAFGISDDGGLFVRTNGEKLNGWLIHSFSRVGLASKILKAGLHEKNLSNQDLMEYDEKQGNLIVYLSSLDEISLFNSDEMIYFTLNGLPIAHGKVKDCLQIDTMRFNQLSFFTESNMTDQDRWLLEYMLNYCDSGDDSYMMDIDAQYYYVSDDSCRIYGDTNHFTLSDGIFYEEDILEKNIKEICQEATVITHYDQGEIEIWLNQKPEKGFIAKSMDIIKEIYENMDFEQSVYETMTFYLYDQKMDERSEIYFVKRFDFDDDMIDYGYQVECNIYFANGRSQEFIKEMNQYLNGDTFYQELRPKDDEFDWGIGVE